MELIELIRTARSLGFDVTDGNGLPVNEQVLKWLETEHFSFAIAPAYLRFRKPPKGRDHGIVAEVLVRDQIYHILGPIADVEQLRVRLTRSFSIEPGPRPRQAGERSNPTGTTRL
ncbi:MAG: hypothetical protein GF355_01305 [Candidatus Eisenbacteria bacterium]|nr:hypothetical protein [Candidatus Eisenbacteria bacterium]